MVPTTVTEFQFQQFIGARQRFTVADQGERRQRRLCRSVIVDVVMDDFIDNSTWHLEKEIAYRACSPFLLIELVNSAIRFVTIYELSPGKLFYF